MPSLLSRFYTPRGSAARPAAGDSPGGSERRADRGAVSGGPAECRWCGNAHDVQELCRPRRVNRRTFLFTTGAAVAGALVAPACPAFQGQEYTLTAFDELAPNVLFAGRRGGKSDAMMWQFFYGTQMLLTDATTGQWYHAVTRDDRRYSR